MAHASNTLLISRPDRDRELLTIVQAFLAGFDRDTTRRAYSTNLRQWFAWCAAHGFDPLEVRRTHVELWLRHLEDRNLARNTRALKFSTLQSFYRWAVDEQLIAAAPTARVKPPQKTHPVLPALTEPELHRFLQASAQIGGDRHAIVTTMLMCCLRVSEACGIDVDDYDTGSGIPLVSITGKGDKPVTKPVPIPAMRAIEALLPDRPDGGALFLNQAGNRMTRANVAAAVVKIAGLADIGKPLTTHSLRRTAIQIALRRGASLRDVQEWAAHAEPRTTARYDSASRAPERSPGWTLMAAAA